MVVSNVESLVTSHANVRMRVLPDREMDRLASTLMLSNFFIKAISYFLLLTLMQVSVSSECHFLYFPSCVAFVLFPVECLLYCVIAVRAVLFA